MNMDGRIMWDILTEYCAALSGGALELTGRAPTRNQAEAEAAAPAPAPPSIRPVPGLLWNKVRRP